MAIEEPTPFDASANAALLAPAPIFTNRFQVIRHGDMVRIVFGSGVDGKSFAYHAAVTMNIADARELEGVLVHVVSE